MSEIHVKEYSTISSDINAESADNIIRDTHSVCPKCMQDIDAIIIERSQKVYLRKECKGHGRFEILISNNAQEYKQLQDCYFYFNSNNLVQSEYYLNASTKCNMNCPICYLRYCQKIDEFPIKRVSQASRFHKINRFTFSHGEPTQVSSLFAMVNILKDSGKMVNMHTNGIKIADYAYAAKLKSSGIDHVSIQFDGFDDEIYMGLRGQKVKANKLKAIENLKVLSIPITLNVTIAKGVNETQVGKIFDYALKEYFIKDISFITYSEYATTKENMDKYIMPDDLINIIDEYTQGAISRRDIILFQKVFYAYCSVIKKRKCFYYYHYMVVRTPKGYVAISEFVDLEKFSRKLEKIKQQKKALNFFIFLWMLSCCLKLKSLKLGALGFKEFFKGGFPRRPIKLLTLTFASICDPYKYDRSIADHCGQGIITDTDMHESYGSYLIEQMKKAENRI